MRLLMCPYIHIFEIDIPAYGLMMLLGMAAALGVVIFQCELLNYSRQDAILVAFVAIAGGIAGAILLRPIIKLPDVIINWEKYSKMPVGEFLAWFIGELVFYGGLIGGSVAAVLYCRYFRISVPYTVDILAPALPVGHAFGRIGCLFAGCCYGVEASPANPLAIIYPERTDGLAALAPPPGTPILATPAIEAGGNILIACIVMLFIYKNKAAGRGIAVYGMLYGVQRFILEFFRGDLIRGVYGGGISTSQIISIFVVAASALWFSHITHKNRETAQ